MVGDVFEHDLVNDVGNITTSIGEDPMVDAKLRDTMLTWILN